VVGLPLANPSGDPSDGKTEAKLNQKRVEDLCGPSGTDWSREVSGPEVVQFWDCDNCKNRIVSEPEGGGIWSVVVWCFGVSDFRCRTGK